MAATIKQLKKQHSDSFKSLFVEGILDRQFKQLYDLQEEDNPEFVKGIVISFFDVNDKLLRNLDLAMVQPNVNFEQVAEHVHQFKSSNCSIGAQRVWNKCVAFKACYDAKNFDRCLKCLQQARDEYQLLKSKLQAVFRLEQQILAAGGSIRIMK